MKNSSTKIAAFGWLAALALTSLATVKAEDPWVVFEGKNGPGVGKHIVFVSGDEEYRSEESMPALAKIMAVHHGFKCTVLFGINPKNNEIDPLVTDNIPGLEALKTADLMVIFTRFRDLPENQMKLVLDYANSGKPIVGLRTATHAFNFKKESPNAKWSYNRKGDFAGGFGRQVLGETWINHYGVHQKESTRGLIAPGMENHPIVRGVTDIWGESDVYGITTLHGDCQPVIMGQVLAGMKPDDKPNADKKQVPVAWTKSFTGESGKAARVFTTTMGHSFDFFSEGFRRLMVNGCYWAMGMESQIPVKSNVDFVGEYQPNKIGFGGFKKGLKPSVHQLK